MPENITYKAIAAVTISGHIARDQHHRSFDWTSLEDKKFFTATMDSADVLITGRHSYETGEEHLRNRNCIVFTNSVDTIKRVHANLTYVNPGTVQIKHFIERDCHYRNPLILGGEKVYSWFLKQGIMNELYLTIEPLLFGGGLSLFSEVLMNNVHCKLLSVEQVNKKGTLFLHYQILNNDYI